MNEDSIEARSATQTPSPTERECDPRMKDSKLAERLARTSDRQGRILAVCALKLLERGHTEGRAQVGLIPGINKFKTAIDSISVIAAANAELSLRQPGTKIDQYLENGDFVDPRKRRTVVVTHLGGEAIRTSNDYKYSLEYPIE